MSESFNNVWDALCDDPGEKKVFEIKSCLMDRVKGYIDKNNLKQKQAAEIMNISQPRVSNLYRGKISKFSIDALIEILTRIGIDIDSLNVKSCKARCSEEQVESGQLHLKIPKSLHRDISLAAESEGVSMATYIVSTLSQKQSVANVTKRLEGRMDRLMEKVNDTKVVVERSLGGRATWPLEHESSFFGIHQHGVAGKIKKEDVCLHT